MGDRDKPIKRVTLDGLMILYNNNDCGEYSMAKKPEKKKHSDEKEDKALIRKMVKSKDLKKK